LTGKLYQTTHGRRFDFLLAFFAIKFMFLLLAPVFLFHRRQVQLDGIEADYFQIDAAFGADNDFAYQGVGGQVDCDVTFGAVG
jgi:hypothetical protein